MLAISWKNFSSLLFAAPAQKEIKHDEETIVRTVKSIV